MINQNLLLTGDDGYNLTKSLRFRSSASAYLNRTPASAGNRKTWTWSGWVKRGALNSGELNYLFMAGASGNETVITFSSNDAAVGANDSLSFYHYSGGFVWQKTTSQVFRDVSAWYHLVLVLDTDNATAEDRTRIYVNGIRVTSWEKSTNPSSGYSSSRVNDTVEHDVGKANFTNRRFDGYLTELNFIDGQALTPSSFGETDALTGVWKVKKYAGTYGTNGFYLPFTNTASTTALGYDFSGNSNNWTTNNISLTAGTTYDSMVDAPAMSALASNYCTLNPLDKNSNTLLTNGNLNIASSTPSTAVWYPASSTIKIPTSGKWYCEMTVGSADTAGYYRIGFGIVTDSFPITTTTFLGNNSQGWGYFVDTGDVYNNSSVLTTLTSAVINDVIGIAFDSDAGTLRFYKNGVAMGASALTGFTSSYFFAISVYAAATAYANFGQRPFSYTPPTGFVALNTFNLPEPSIKAGNKYMDAVLYTGTTGSNLTVSSVGFQPDFVWLKARNQAGYGHQLYDAVRGVQLRLRSNTTDAEGTNTGGLLSFNSNGYTVGTDGFINETGTTMASWVWKAGNSAGSSNTAGSITSTVSANPTAGFSVITFTGNATTNGTVGHGLGVAPKLYIQKKRNGTGSWYVYTTVIDGSMDYLVLNTTAAKGDLTDALPTSSVLTNHGWDASSNIICYAFAEVAGYSKFGSYTGNGSTDGTFVHLGFRPAFVVVKQTNASGQSWYMTDKSRAPYNVVGNTLQANLSDAEFDSGGSLDFLSNGFKIRESSSGYNGSGSTYIYMAFAENPQKYSLGR